MLEAARKHRELEEKRESWFYRIFESVCAALMFWSAMIGLGSIYFIIWGGNPLLGVQIFVTCLVTFGVIMFIGDVEEWF